MSRGKSKHGGRVRAPMWSSEREHRGLGAERAVWLFERFTAAIRPQFVAIVVGWALLSILVIAKLAGVETGAALDDLMQMLASFLLGAAMSSDPMIVRVDPGSHHAKGAKGEAYTLRSGDR